MTSANRSSEPIAYDEQDAFERLAGIADAFWSASGRSPAAWTIRWRGSARFGPVILRRSRGYAPGAVASLPCRRPLLAVGRRSEEHRHAGGRRAGIRQPAHRRPRSLPGVPGVSGNHSRPDRDVRRGLGRAGRGARCASAVSSRPCMHALTWPRAASSRCSIIARTLHRCWPNAGRGKASARRQLRRHRLWRRWQHLGRRVLRRQRARRDSSAWRICAARARRAAMPQRSIRCRPRPDFWRRSKACPI